jgi:nitroimidazol reductase NimA-like FMN-containing flavoprotein (pyridoxamine 5'-phosphate oxidase superfamily)
MHQAEALTSEASLDLLGSVPFGRIAYTDKALPAVQPVPFLMDQGSVIIRTGTDSRLGAVTHSTVVAFQADQLDPQTREGWSVMIVGRAEPVTDPAEAQRLGERSLESWFDSDDGQFIRISVELVDGWRTASVKISESATVTSGDA